MCPQFTGGVVVGRDKDGDADEHPAAVSVYADLAARVAPTESQSKELMAMDGKTLQKTAADYAEELPQAGLEHPFGPEWEVYKVRGKVFMLMTQVTGEPLVILKSAPDEAAALRHEHVEITPGYHMNKKHWITLEGGDTIDETLVKELVTDSYRLVVSGLAKSRQPVDPHTYGRHA